jgi:hypothetical protein
LLLLYQDLSVDQHHGNMQTSPRVHRYFRHRFAAAGCLPPLVQEQASIIGSYIHPAQQQPSKGQANNQNYLGNRDWQQ